MSAPYEIPTALAWRASGAPCLSRSTYFGSLSGSKTGPTTPAEPDAIFGASVVNASPPSRRGARRIVRATASFFQDLDRQLGPERGADGEPSSNDFQVFDLQLDFDLEPDA